LNVNRIDVVFLSSARFRRTTRGLAAWVTLLTLVSCGNTVATVAPPTPEGSTTVAAHIVLSDDGLGVVKFGQDTTEVLAKLTNTLGPPKIDSGWHPEQIGCDIGENIRDVSWDDLTVEFSNGPSPLAEAGKEHLLFYFYSADSGKPTPYVTDSGLKLGDSVTTIKSLYPKATFSNSEIEGPVFEVSDSPIGVNGNLSSLDDAGTVTSIRAGVLCID
jgi:hypothetical protein